MDFHANAIKEISQKLGWKTDGKGRICALIDSAANQHTLACSKSVAELFSERGILVNTNVNKDVFSGIARVKSFLKQGNGEGNLYIFSNCVNMIAELTGYFWADGDSPVKRDDHCMDELRYYVMNRPRPAEKERCESAVYADKMRRIRRLKSTGGKQGKR